VKHRAGEAIRPCERRNSICCKTDQGRLVLRPRGRGRAKTKKLVGRREQNWLLLGCPAASSLSAAEALDQQQSLTFSKYVLEAPGGPPMMRADLSLVPEITAHGPRLRTLLAAAVAPESPPRGPAPAPEEVHLHLRAGLADLGKLEEATEGFSLPVDIGGGRSRPLSIALSARQVHFSLPFVGPEVELDGPGLEIVATYLLALNGLHFLARAGIRAQKPVAELLLPLAHMTPAEYRLAVGALTAFAACERTLELLVADGRARRLYAAHHGLALGSPRPEPGN
jgi:hypothetical protein